MLNAGSGVYEINDRQWLEIPLDLFAAPIRGRQYGVCGSIADLPFRSASFQIVICVGEVLVDMIC